MLDKRLTRVDATQLALTSPRPYPVRIFANEQVMIEPVAITELHQVLDQYGDHIQQVAITPDFHKGAGIPIGTVLKTHGTMFPEAIGNDINCGMRLHTTTLEASEIPRYLDALETHARRLFFEGARQIPMTGADREALLTEGLTGLFRGRPCDRLSGQWQLVARHDWHNQLDHVEQRGSLLAANAAIFASWIGDSKSTTYDDQIGSIGGGNHFVEIQRVERILDRKTAYAWGLEQGAVAIMVHSGSVGIGHTAGRFIKHGVDVWNPLHNAANFAFANRLFLAASAVETLERVFGQSFKAPLLYDSPHNLVWKTEDGGYLHRKGATPARGPDATNSYLGEPVLVPGSMGSSSYILAGQGNADSLDSASHGAGRALSRGQASRSSKPEFADFLKHFRVVTPLDLRRPEVRGRADILNRKLDELRAEGPHAYKSISAIIDTLAAARIAKPVAELVPLMTLKS